LERVRHQNQEALSTYELAPSMQYMHRLQYSRSMWRPDSYLMVANDQYKQFLDAGEVDVGVLAEFIQTLAPRSVADMKPMLVLIQVRWRLIHMLPISLYTTTTGNGAPRKLSVLGLARRQAYRVG
jgi:hypothetical protein